MADWRRMAVRRTSVRHSFSSSFLQPARFQALQAQYKIHARQSRARPPASGLSCCRAEMPRLPGAAAERAPHSALVRATRPSFASLSYFFTRCQVIFSGKPALEAFRIVLVSSRYKTPGASGTASLKARQLWRVRSLHAAQNRAVCPPACGTACYICAQATPQAPSASSSRCWANTQPRCGVFTNGKRGHLRRKPQPYDGPAAVQPAFRVRNDVHLFRARFAQHLAQARASSSPLAPPAGRTAARRNKAVRRSSAGPPGCAPVASSCQSLKKMPCTSTMG